VDQWDGEGIKKGWRRTRGDEQEAGEKDKGEELEEAYPQPTPAASKRLCTSRLANL
jgi:hypothetical protein